MVGERRPAHLAPIFAALEGFVLPGPWDSGVPEVFRSGRLEELRRHLTRTVLTSLRDRPGTLPEWTEEDIVARGLAYVHAVRDFTAATAARFPVDPCLVALNGHLRPVLRAGFREEDAGPTSLLIDPAGVLYADPISVALAAVSPAAISEIALRGPSGGFAPAGQAAAALRTGFRWPEYPILAVRTETGTVVVHHPDHTWSTIEPTPRAAPPPLVPPSEWQIGAARRICSQSSVSKGARGEDRVFKILGRSTSYVVRDVSRRPRSADMVVETPGGKIFVDSKDYSSAVPSKEVQKFWRDLGARGADAGVLVSLSSGVAGVRRVLSAALEVLPGEGRAVPVVYATSGHEDVVTAAVDLAAYLAKINPGTCRLAALHPRDALEAYTADLEDIADLHEDARAELGRLASTISAGLGDLFEKQGIALRDERRLIRAQRAALEEVEDVGAAPPAVWGLVAARYSPPEEVAEIVKAILQVLCGGRLGDICEEARWRFCKKKAVHLATESAFCFSKSRTEFSRPLARFSNAWAGTLLQRHPRRVRVVDEVLALELCKATALDAERFAAA